MSKCKECKYFVERKAEEFRGFNPQPFGQKQTKSGKLGYCHLHPPGVNGQHLMVSENDWCSYCTQAEIEQSAPDSDEQETKQDDQSAE